jgi:3-oxoacyl-[acyl-carrier protein] reductase
MLLKNKNALIYGVSPSLGGAVAKAFAAAGANVYVSNRHLSVAQQIADEINAAGGYAEADDVDALEETEVNAYVEKITKKAGSIDISFNLIGIPVIQDIPLVQMTTDDFVRPISLTMLTHFLTSTAAGRVMSKQGSGVILSLTATPGGIGYAKVGGFGPACCAVEAFSTNLASELGPHGVRVVNIRSGGSPDSRPFKEAIEQGGEPVKEFLKKMADDTMLKKMPLMQDIANTAVFLASHMAGSITGVTVDVTAGTTAALNYKETEIAFLQQQ